MVDIHCHILPGVDDGAPSMEDSLEMARMAADYGIVELARTGITALRRGGDTIHSPH